MERYIAKALSEYLGNENIPWHMPGHKRKSLQEDNVAQTELTVDQILNFAMSIDITEVPGMDDLHHPEGIIRDSMEELKRLYGTYASYYLINGSTCGIMSAISACASQNTLNEDKYIIVARNCHKSVYNAVELLNLKPIYVEPKRLICDKKTVPEIYSCINPDDVDALCKKYKGIIAAVITNPTYDGVISDISAISEVLRDYNIKLIVDEAHGAHLPFMENTPKSAIQCGADIVIQSLHKTLPSLTQTAVLHVMNGSIDEEIRKYLSIFQSSSPSYLLMYSMEMAVAWAAEQDFGDYFKILEEFRERISKLNNIGIIDRNLVKVLGAYDYDETRIVIYATLKDEKGYRFISGSQLADIIKQYGNIVCEMEGNDYVVLISSALDGANDFEHLAKTLEHIDADISCGNLRTIDFKDNIQDSEINEDVILKLVGTVAIDDIYVYPPGSYILTPGELITDKAAETLVEYIKSGRTIRGRLFDN